MSWHPNDLVSDTDLESYEAAIMTGFGQTSWLARRTKALEDWLFPHLKVRGHEPQRFRTRYECDGALGATGTPVVVYTDVLAATRDTTEDDIDLAAVFVTPASDALYIGSNSPFMGIFLRILDDVSSVTGTMSVAYWNGGWEPFTITDRTLLAGKTLGKGGSVTWALPPDWAVRHVNAVGPHYWVRVRVSAVPTGAKATQIGTIRASSIRAAATYRTLQLIFMEAPTGADGPWAEKAAFYAGEADAALQRAFLLVAGEFDTDKSDLIGESETLQVEEFEPFSIERR